jgi:hypothetical protein
LVFLRKPKEQDKVVVKINWISFWTSKIFI